MALQKSGAKTLYLAENTVRINTGKPFAKDCDLPFKKGAQGTMTVIIEKKD